MPSTIEEKATRIHSVHREMTGSPCIIILTPEHGEVNQICYPAHQLGCLASPLHANNLLYWPRGENPEKDPIQRMAHPVL